MNQEIIADDILINELQRRLDDYKKTLFDLKDLNRELQMVNKKLLESDAMKSHFISNITNEIINPFASIIGLSRSILLLKDSDWSKAQNMARLINYEAFNLDFQLRNIFAAAQIEAGEVYPQISNVDIPQVFNGVIESFDQEIRQKKLKIQFTCSGSSKSGGHIFKTDAEKLKLILSNLLSNAIKFSNDEERILMDVKIDEISMSVCVQDFGIGISEENQQIIFDRFSRIDNGINSINRGHGLGLSINKAYIELLEGSIQVKSAEGDGALFKFSIPLPKSEGDGFSSDGNEIFFSDDEIF